MHIDNVIFLILSKNAYTKFSEGPFIRDNKKIYRAAFRNPNDMQAHARYGELKKRLLSPILDRFSVPAPYHRYYIAYYN